MNDLINQVNFQEISSKGQEIYDSCKLEYEPVHNGKFLAIETETKKVYLGDTSTCLEQARQVHPGKVFYVVKIGSNHGAKILGQTFARVCNV